MELDSDRSSRSGNEDSDAAEPDWMYLVRVGENVSYTIPTFNVLTVQLRHVVTEVENKNTGDIVRIDTFFRDDECLGTLKPGTKIIALSSCTVDVNDLARIKDVTKLRLLSPGEVWIVWEWEASSPSCSSDDIEWRRDDSIKDSDSSGDSSDSDDSDASDDDENISSELPAMPVSQHTVKFKCIGVTLDVSYQTTLRRARDLRNSGVNVCVRLEPEPSNPVDSKAIAFVTEVDGKWRRIGYVVTEVLDEVHAALHAGRIISVRFAWIKYISDWTRSGPGYFAGINVTRYGNWSPNVSYYSSTR